MKWPLFADVGTTRPLSISSVASGKDDAVIIDKALGRELELALKTVEPLMKDAEQKQFRCGSVRNWLVELKNSIYDAETALDFIRAETGPDKPPDEVPYDSSALVRFRRELPAKVKGIVDSLMELCSRKDSIGLTVNPDASNGSVVATNGITTSLVDESEVVGRGQEKTKIKEWVLSEEGCAAGIKVDVLTIFGMGGVGKTALARLVYNDPDLVSSGSYLRSWLCVSDGFEVVRLTKEILESITDKSYDTNNWDKLQLELSVALKEKKFLVVLDDVSDKNSEVWERFMIPFSYGANGSKIVVTTRDKDVAFALKSSHDLQLNPLSEEEGWSLFSSRAFRGGVGSTDRRLVAIGEKIVKECKGLPLAIKAALGVLLSCGKDVKQWERVLRSNLWNKPEVEARLHASSVLPTALAVSYCCLSPHLKRCFAYCSLFPKGHKFNKNELVMLWIDEGFVQQNESDSIEDIAGDYFDELVSRSFLQLNSNHGWYEMHDLTHYLAGFVSENFCKPLERNKPIANLERIRHISLQEGRFHGTENYENLVGIGSLHTFFYICNSGTNGNQHEFSREDLRTMSLQQLSLRVLRLEGGMITELPDTIGNLRLLRHLNVASTNIRELPASVCNLSNLRFLKCNSCRELKEVPYQIGNLVSLKSLNVSKTSIEELPGSICTLSKLEELDCGDCEKLKRLPDEIGNLVSLKSLNVSKTSITELPASICTLSKLEELDCGDCEKLERLPDEIGNLVSLTSLNVSKTSIKELPASICTLSNMTTLHCGGCRNLQMLPDEIGRLGWLQVLNASYTAIKELPASLCALPKLEKLECEGCLNLQRLPNKIGDLAELHTLVLRGVCGSVFATLNLRHHEW